MSEQTHKGVNQHLKYFFKFLCLNKQIGGFQKQDGFSALKYLDR